MQREYDLFEQLPDGSPIWRGHVMGGQELSRKLEEIAEQTGNECFAIHLPTQHIVARVNGMHHEASAQSHRPGQSSSGYHDAQLNSSHAGD